MEQESKERESKKDKIRGRREQGEGQNQENLRLSGRERNIIKVNKEVQHLTVMALDPTRATTTKQILHIKCVLYFKQDANIEYSMRYSTFKLGNEIYNA